MNNAKLRELDDMLIKHCHECEHYELVEKYDYSKAVVESIEKLYGEKSNNRFYIKFC